MMFIEFLYLSLTIPIISAMECDELGVLIYEDLGCVPEHEPDKECPSGYSCKGLESSSTHCYFRGKSYENNEDVDESLTYPSCDVGCFCDARDGKSRFICAVLDCPEWLGVPVTYGCYRNYSLGHCCSSGQICPPFDDIEECEVDGVVYKEGQRFYPKDTCLSCICMKGFQGKFEAPFCERQTCGQQLRRSGGDIQASCAPFYKRDNSEKVLCCPDDWICPNGMETVEGDPQSEASCKFGKDELKIGQHFERTNVEVQYGHLYSKVKCECVVPPLLTCLNVIE